MDTKFGPPYLSYSFDQTEPFLASPNLANPAKLAWSNKIQTVSLYSEFLDPVTLAVMV